nr:hypothetical protein [Tanacetum cinerariifolium]
MEDVTPTEKNQQGGNCGERQTDGDVLVAYHPTQQRASYEDLQAMILKRLCSLVWFITFKTMVRQLEWDNKMRFAGNDTQKTMFFSMVYHFQDNGETVRMGQQDAYVL